jgi:hypothetical protein
MKPALRTTEPLRNSSPVPALASTQPAPEYKFYMFRIKKIAISETFFNSSIFTVQTLDTQK